MSNAVRLLQAELSPSEARPLRGLERVQASLGGLHYADVIIAEISGLASMAALQPALRALVARHAVLRCRVARDPVLGPVTEEITAFDLPIGMSISPWEDAVEALLDSGFGDGPSWRLQVIQGGRSHHLALAVHHALVDGRSLSVLLSDLVRALEGEALGPPLPPPPSALALAPAWPRWLAPAVRLGYSWRTRRVQATTPLPGRRLAEGEAAPTRFGSRGIPADILEKIRCHGRLVGATVGGAVVEAAWSATAALAGDASVEMMVDIRPWLPGAPAVGMYASGVLALTGRQASTGWGRASVATRQVHRQVRLGVPLLAHAAFEGVDADTWMAGVGVDLAANGGTGAVTQVSNVGLWTGPTRVGRRRIRGVWSATSAIRGGPALMLWLRTVEGRGHLSAIGNGAVVSGEFLERWLDAVVAALIGLARHAAPEGGLPGR